MNPTIKNEGKFQLAMVRLWRWTLCHLCWRWMAPAINLLRMFLQEPSVYFCSPCQCIPRCRHPENTRNSCGFAVWVDVKFHDGLPKWWENKCLDCYSSANLDFSLMLPASWGQGVYKTWVWSADCGFKPRGHTICDLLAKVIEPATLGQTLRLYLVSHRVKSMIFYCDFISF